MKSYNKIRRLMKGSIRRIHGKYDPVKAAEPIMSNMMDWLEYSDPKLRDKLATIDRPQLKNELARALNKLASRTQSRRNPETGEREFLLHRGVGWDENRDFDKNRSKDYKKHSSWTPHYHKAAKFAKDYAGDAWQSYVKTAWIPAKHIALVPNQFFPESQYKDEHEIIVAPHTISEAPASDVPKLAPPPPPPPGGPVSATDALKQRIRSRLARKSLEDRVRAKYQPSDHFEELQKSRKKDYLKHLGNDPKAAEVVDWTVQNTPNRNWSDWVIRNYKKDPSSLNVEVKASIKHFNSMIHLPHVNNFRFDPSHDFSSGISGLKDAETKSLAAQKNKRPTVPQKGKKLIDLGNGWAWWNLGEPSCREEGEAMGHCGNTAEEHDEDKVLSLRQEVSPGKFLPHVTAIFNNGFIGETKGPNNSKPSEKHHKAILELLKHKKVKGVIGSGYKPENNFQHHDLSEEDYESLLKIKPRIFSPDISELPEKWEDSYTDDLPPEITDKSLGDNISRKKVTDLLLDPSLTSDRLEALASEHGGVLYSIVADNIDAPLEVLVKVASSDLAGLSAMAAGNLNMPPEALAKLANSNNSAVVAKVARHPNTPPEVLAKLANHNNLEVAAGVAANENTPPEVLELLALAGNMEIARRVAWNKKTPPEALAELANHDAIGVVEEVAHNTSTPPEVLAKLANHSDAKVMMRVASNPNTPPEALAKLANSVEPIVATGAASNPNTPPEVLAKLASHSDAELVRYVAKNPNTPPEALAKLADRNDSFLVGLIIRNPNTPPEVFKKLENHKNPVMRFMAFDRIPRHPKEYSQWERLAHKPDATINDRNAASRASSSRSEAVRRILLTETLGPNAKERDLEIYKHSHDDEVREAARKEIKRRSTINKSDALRKSQGESRPTFWDGYNRDLHQSIDDTKNLQIFKDTISGDVRVVGQNNIPMAVLKPPLNASQLKIGQNELDGPGTSFFLRDNFRTSHREAAYHLLADQFFGLGSYIPRSTVYTPSFSNEKWSAQQYVDASRPVTESDIGHNMPATDLYRMAIMDSILGNHDRHGGNILVSKNGSVHFIDNSGSFDYAHKFLHPTPNYAKSIAYEDVPDDVKAWVKYLQPIRLEDLLKRAGAPSPIIDMALNRLKEAQNWSGATSLPESNKKLAGLISVVQTHSFRYLPEQMQEIRSAIYRDINSNNHVSAPSEDAVGDETETA